MTAPPAPGFLPDIVAEHYDELQFLWTQRRAALCSPAYRARELRLLEERIEAHLEGLLVIGDRVLEFVEPGLAGDDEMPAFAAASALLRLATPDALRRVGYAFETASGKKLDGLRDALAHATTVGPLRAQLAALIQSAAPAISAAAGEVLAFHGALTPDPRQLGRLVGAEAAGARAAAWRIVAYCGVTVPDTWFDAALRDEDPAVRRAALTAGAWTGSPWFVACCRRLAANPAPEAIETLATWAAIAPPEDYEIVDAVASNAAAGPDRFRVVGAFAHPYFVERLIAEMESPDPATAVAAGAAFEKMTGRSAESDRRAKLPPDGRPPADSFEEEFQDDVFLPDAALARSHWQQLAPRLARSPRICRGMDVSQPLGRDDFAALDMESRWQYCLRARLFSGWQGTPLVLERYPQQF